MFIIVNVSVLIKNKKKLQKKKKQEDQVEISSTNLNQCIITEKGGMTRHGKSQCQSY